MTDYQNELVMEHLDLVNWVIRTRISVPNRPLLTYDDFYAIGCEAICRAALKYQADSGEFAPFACRYMASSPPPASAMAVMSATRTRVRMARSTSHSSFSLMSNCFLARECFGTPLAVSRRC